MTTWLDGPLLGFDTETTGVNPFRDRIVSAALIGRGPRGSAQRVWLLNPGVPIPEEAAAIHQITTAHATEHGMAPREALAQISAELLAAFRRGTPVVAYNAAFDLTILERELERHGLPTLGEELGGPLAPVLDPLLLDRGLAADRNGRRTLLDLCGYYGVQENGRLHTADVDVAATLDILAAQVRDHPELTRQSPATLHHWQAHQHSRWARAEVERRRRSSRAAPAPGWPLHTSDPTAPGARGPGARSA
ncbi:DNA polymerase III subunit epsilon [Ruania alkalisoli]|uniref:DNA polymerase III subunit epsilon n=1 Tax=Ruania alkalisoli TaxID=2779775 RepID=A0A7M1ST09_9MICO|nr:exonuclease domain-containing protein [Ruania alkalisoli]QOR69922.1 DNA polymerase III subunit epsilon [Ruania alkalisoli]